MIVLIPDHCLSIYFARMFIFIKFRSDSKLGHVGSKTRSLCQILEKPRYFMKLSQNVCHHEI